MRTERGGGRRSGYGVRHRGEIGFETRSGEDPSNGAALVGPSVCNEANTGHPTQRTNPRSGRAAQSWARGLTARVFCGGEIKPNSPHDDWGACGEGMQMIFSKTIIKRPTKADNPGSLQRWLKAIGFPGGSWAPWGTPAGCSPKNCCTGPPCWAGSARRRCATRPEPSGSCRRPPGRFCAPRDQQEENQQRAPTSHPEKSYGHFGTVPGTCFSLSVKSCTPEQQKHYKCNNSIRLLNLGKQCRLQCPRSRPFPLSRYGDTPSQRNLCSTYPYDADEHRDRGHRKHDGGEQHEHSGRNVGAEESNGCQPAAGRIREK